MKITRALWLRHDSFRSLRTNVARREDRQWRPCRHHKAGAGRNRILSYRTLRPRLREQRAFHLRTGGQVRLVRELKRAGPRIVAYVVAGIAQREAAPARAGRGIAGRAMDDHGMEDEAVAGLHLPPFDVVVRTIGVDVGDLHEVARGELDLMALAERRRSEIDAPFVRAGDERDGAVAAVDMVERDPDRGDLPALHRPVRLVLVPRRGMGRARLLHEELVVEEVGARGAHQPRGN